VIASRADRFDAEEQTRYPIWQKSAVFRVSAMDPRVAHISFDELKSYWIEVDHFRHPEKKFRQVVRRLGPYQSTLDDPKRHSYGLFDGDRLIGVTHLVQWSDDLVRYRTLNVRPPYRGRNLGELFLERAVNLDWGHLKSPGKYLLGWIRRDHQPWACAHGFDPLDGSWHDDHIAMIRPLDTF
jgi:GNAT superfamily N-acetyltransferase